MLRSDMKLKIKTRTVRYNNKILVSHGNFSLGKKEKVNSLETPAMVSTGQRTQLARELNYVFVRDTKNDTTSQDRKKLKKKL